MIVNLQPMLGRNRYSDDEWEYASSGRCSWETEFGMHPGRVVRCGAPSDPRSFYRWCMDHDCDAREESPSTYGT